MNFDQQLDILCDRQSHCAEYEPDHVFSPDDFRESFTAWVADLGRREGEYLRSKWLDSSLDYYHQHERKAQE